MQSINIGRLNGGYVAFWWEGSTRRRFRLKAKNLQAAKVEGARIYDGERAKKGHNLTFQDLKDAYEGHLGDRRTADQLKDVWKNMGPVLGGYPADKIDDRLMANFLHERQDQAVKRRGYPLSNGTLFIDVNIAQSIFNYASKKNLIPFRVSFTKPVKPAPKEIWFNKKQVKKLLKQLSSVPHLYTATLLMLSTAGRVGAILELTWDRIDFKENWIDLRVDPEKPAKGRAKIPMNEGLRAHLQLVKAESDCDFVVAYRGQGVASIYKAFKAHCREAGLGKGSPHVLRHTAAIHMVAAGCPMAKVSQYLGHSSVGVTERIYARFQPEHLRDEAKAVDFVSHDDD